MLVKEYVRINLNKIEKLQEEIDKIKNEPYMKEHFDMVNKIKAIDNKLMNNYRTFPGITTLTSEGKKQKESLEEQLRQLDARYDLWQFNEVEE